MKVVIIIFLIFVIYCIAENALILVSRHEKLGKGLKIAHVSDLHKRKFGKDNKKLTEKIANEKPDIIFITGDIVSRDETDISHLENLFSELKKSAPVYFIFGNHEQSIPENFRLEIIDIAKRTGIVLLRNETVKVKIKDRPLNITGVEQNYTVYKKNHSYKDLDGFEYNEMIKLVGECPKGETLLLAHNPLFAETYSKWGAEYTFSGHVHGGIIRIFGKGLLSPERKFFPKYSKGVYSIGSMKLCVSAGLGKLRLFNPPEIVFYEI